MSTPAAVYRVISRIHKNQWDDRLGVAVAGWELKALWLATGTVLPIFVSDDHYDPTYVDGLIRAAGARDDAMHALGG